MTERKPSSHSCLLIPALESRTLGVRRGLAVIVSLAVLLGMVRCSPPTPPLPTSTPTRTPVLPTSTPTSTLTPTPTSTPTPTLPPGLVLPATPESLSRWEPLPADLYFVREGRIFHWLAEGSSLEQLPIAEGRERDSIIDFLIARDGRELAYLTNQQELFVFDQAAWQHTRIPTSGWLLGETGSHFALLPGGRYLVYLAWHVAPPDGESDPGSPATHSGMQQVGSIQLIDVTAPLQPERVVAPCYADRVRSCEGFLLSPDGVHIVIYDAYGIRVNALWSPDEIKIDLPPDFRAEELAWNEDGTRLIASLTSSDEVQIAVISLLSDPAPGRIRIYPICSMPCKAAFALSEQTLWSVYTKQTGGCIAEGPVPSSIDAGWPQDTVCLLDGQAFEPAYPQPISDSAIAFLQRGCDGQCLNPPPGLYILQRDSSILPIALLPPTLAKTAQVLWHPRGSAFLILSAEGTPEYLGITAGGGFWDVRQMLYGSQLVQWGDSDTSFP